MASASASEEYQYIELLRRIIEDGDRRSGRNGDTLSVFGVQSRYSLRDGNLPLLTTKKLAWKTCLRELFWFISGNTNNQTLREMGVKIWDANASRSFLDSRGLYHLETDDLGPVYGHQWRHFNAPYVSCHSSYEGQGVDQLTWVINALKNTSTAGGGENRWSRRLIVSAWNPQQIHEMALPPCHVMFQFYVNSRDELSCSLYQRSGDVGLGVPFNIASYAFLTHIVAHHCGLKTGELVHTIGDAHIYAEHVDALREQMTREPYEFAQCRILNTYDTIDEYKFSDVEVVGYVSHPTVEMKMIA
jgi:thymidylate synthase